MLALKFRISSILLFISFISHSQTEDLLNANLIPDELKTKANAVIRLNELKVEIKSQEELHIVQKRIVTVLNEKGNYAVQAYSGFDRYNKIKKIEARIFDEYGNQIKKK